MSILSQIYLQRKSTYHKRDLVKWSYLSRVHLPQLKAEIGLLNGAKMYKAIEPWEIINSQNDWPYAVKTVLGCVVNKPISRCQEKGTYNDKRQRFLVSCISAMNMGDFGIDEEARWAQWWSYFLLTAYHMIKMKVCFSWLTIFFFFLDWGSLWPVATEEINVSLIF